VVAGRMVVAGRPVVAGRMVVAVARRRASDRGKRNQQRAEHPQRP